MQVLVLSKKAARCISESLINVGGDESASARDTRQALTVLEGPLLHVGLLLGREAQEAEHAVLEGRHLELGAEVLVAGLEVASQERKRTLSKPRLAHKVLSPSHQLGSSH